MLLQTARTSLHNPSAPHISIGVRLLLDSGSQRSYITEEARILLKLEPSREQLLEIATFGASDGQRKVCEIVNVGMQGYSPMSLSLYVVPTICNPLASQPIATCIEQSDLFKDLEFAYYSDGSSTLRVDVLIGCDYYWELVSGDVRRSEHGPTAVHTKFGWVVSGPNHAKSHSVCAATLMTTHVLRTDTKRLETVSLEEQLRSFWELESLGIQQEEKTLYNDFTSNIAFSQGRYQVTLPWKEFHEVLPDHYQLSLKRLHGLMRRLRQ